LSDAQLEAEVKRFANARGWPHGPNVEFFMFTPSNVGSCYDSADCAYDVYCAYHSEFDSGSTSSEYIYANMPWPNQSVTFDSTTYDSDCDSGQHPNGTGAALDVLNAADEVLNVTSHESNESITDPLGDAWWVADPNSVYAGYENGDLCAWYFPHRANQGGSTGSGTAYNQSINGGHYFLQGEWSNASSTSNGNSGCVWEYAAAVPTNTAGPTITGTATLGQVLTAHAGTWTQAPSSYSYQWQRCDSGGANCSSLGSAVDTSAASVTYTVASGDLGHTLRVEVAASNDTGAGSPVTSAATAVIASGEPVYTSGLAITGATTVGRKLTATAGSWSPAATKYRYQWERCNSGGGSCTIFSTTNSTSSTSDQYKLVSADRGHTIRVIVTARNAVGPGDPQTSAATAVVQ
jgi:hypothetical protein